MSVGVDGSLSSRAALCWAIDHAHDGDTITLVNIWEPSPAMIDAGLCEPDDDAAAVGLTHRELVRAELLLEKSGVTLRSDVIRGDPRHCLCDLDTDLLIVGAGERRGVAGRLLGSVSDYLARHAPYPLVIVPRQHS
jgi:nucleotide-binding universal stress UspA family protein